jgi:hypothetical protein
MDGRSGHIAASISRYCAEAVGAYIVSRGVVCTVRVYPKYCKILPHIANSRNKLLSYNTNKRAGLDNFSIRENMAFAFGRAHPKAVFGAGLAIRGLFIRSSARGWVVGYCGASRLSFPWPQPAYSSIPARHLLRSSAVGVRCAVLHSTA